MSVRQLAEEVHTAIREAAGGRTPSAGSIFNKPGEEYVAYGLRAPVLYATLKPFRSRILSLSLDERLALAGRLLRERIGEVGHAGIHVLSLSRRELGPEHFERLDGMHDDFIGWSHVDNFCDGVVQDVLRRHPGETIAQLRKWNSSANRWKRRTSVVVFTRKVGESGEFTDVALELCEKLLFDAEDLVQKGVGWALKDVMRGDRERVLAYVKELRRRGVSSTITLYAIRDLKGAERAKALAVRAVNEQANK